MTADRRGFLSEVTKMFWGSVEVALVQHSDYTNCHRMGSFKVAGCSGLPYMYLATTTTES